MKGQSAFGSGQVSMNWNWSLRTGSFLRPTQLCRRSSKFRNKIGVVNFSGKMLSRKFVAKVEVARQTFATLKVRFQSLSAQKPSDRSPLPFRSRKTPSAVRAQPTASGIPMRRGSYARARTCTRLPSTCAPRSKRSRCTIPTSCPTISPSSLRAAGIDRPRFVPVKGRAIGGNIRRSS